MTQTDYERFDLIIGMDQWNLRNIRQIVREDPQQKIHRLLDYSARPRDIADPWYTGDFDATYDDIVEGCGALLMKYS